jgi:hypothetical protein
MSSSSKIVSKIIETDKLKFNLEVENIISSKMKDFAELLKKSVQDNLDECISKFYNCSSLQELEEKVFDNNIYFINFKNYVGCIRPEEDTKWNKIVSNLKIKESVIYFFKHTIQDSVIDVIFTNNLIILKDRRSSTCVNVETHNIPINTLYIIKYCLNGDFKGLIYLLREKPYLVNNSHMEFEGICKEEYRLIDLKKETIEKEASQLEENHREFIEEKTKYREKLEKVFKYLSKGENEEDLTIECIQKKILENLEQFELNQKEFLEKQNQFQRQQEEYQNSLIKIVQTTSDFKGDIDTLDISLLQDKVIQKLNEEYKKVETMKKELENLYRSIQGLKIEKDKLEKKSSLCETQSLEIQKEKEKLKLVKISLDRLKEKLEEERKEFDREKKEFLAAKEEQKIKSIDLDEYFSENNSILENILVKEKEENDEKCNILEVMLILIDGQEYHIDKDDYLYDINSNNLLGYYDRDNEIKAPLIYIKGKCYFKYLHNIITSLDFEEWGLYNEEDDKIYKFTKTKSGNHYTYGIFTFSESLSYLGLGKKSIECIDVSLKGGFVTNNGVMYIYDKFNRLFKYELEGLQFIGFYIFKKNHNLILKKSDFEELSEERKKVYIEYEQKYLDSIKIKTI